MQKRINNSIKVVKKAKKSAQKIVDNFFNNTLALEIKKTPENILILKYPESKKTFDKSRIRISHWNINGIRASLKKKEAREYFENTELDFLCYNETKINKKKFLKVGVEK